VGALCCKECGGPVESFENWRKNQQWTVQTDSFRCLRCGRIIESIRPVHGGEFK